MNAYSWDAQDYERSSSAQQLWARELLAKLHLDGTEHVLDIGCGDGKVTAAIASRVREGAVVGIDNSREMITLARQRYACAAQAPLWFLLADARALPFVDEFDLVFSNAALHWVKDHRPVLAGIYQSLRPSGRVLLQMGGAGNAAGIVRVVEKLIASSAWCTHFDAFAFPYGFHGPEKYGTWLAAAGFTPLRVELLPKDMTQEGRAGLEGWIRTTWLPYTQRVPEDKRGEFIAEIARRYLVRYPLDQDGNAHVPMVRLEVEAVKGS